MCSQLRTDRHIESCSWSHKNHSAITIWIYIALHYITLRYITLYYIISYYIIIFLHYIIKLHFIALHYITKHTYIKHQWLEVINRGFKPWYFSYHQITPTRNCPCNCHVRLLSISSHREKLWLGKGLRPLEEPGQVACFIRAESFCAMLLFI